MRLLCALFVFFACLAVQVRPAFAQATINVANEKSLPRLDKNGNTITKRPLTLNPEAVNFQDCVDDQQIRFTLLMGGFEANAVIEVWAANGGVDCGQQLNRASANQLCWQVSGNVPLQQTVDVNIPVRKIMAGAPPNKPTALNDTADVCGQVDLSNLSVQFLYFKPGDRATAASKKDIGVTVDTIGPSAPTGLKVLPGNTRVQVSWDNISGEGGVSALTGVRVYCDPAQAAAPTTVQVDATCTQVPNEASTSPDADTDAEAGATTEDAGFTEVCTDGGSQTVAGSDCASSNFVKTGADGKPTPIIPDADFNAKYQCGEITGNTGTTVIADKVAGNPLTNGTRYAVAVAATDAYGNVGPLSSVICETPEETNDFWNAYRAAGGQAGGGFCATSGPGAPTGSLAALGLVVAAAVSMVRRKLEGRR